MTYTTQKQVRASVPKWPKKGERYTLRGFEVLVTKVERKWESVTYTFLNEVGRRLSGKSEINDFMNQAQRVTL